LIIEQWQKDRQQLSDYQKEVILLNKQKEEQESKNRLDAFMARKNNA